MIQWKPVADYVEPEWDRPGVALPPLLFVAVYRMNPDYLMLLFTDDLGKKMLIGGILLQLLGALVIRKIVNIRV